MVVNFRVSGISQGMCKLARTSTVIKKKKERNQSINLTPTWQSNCNYAHFSKEQCVTCMCIPKEITSFDFHHHCLLAQVIWDPYFVHLQMR